jgi:cell division protein FtsI/penicillin-binding protein 2
MTLLQLACAFSVIATGYKVTPILICPHPLAPISTPFQSGSPSKNSEDGGKRAEENNSSKMFEKESSPTARPECFLSSKNVSKDAEKTQQIYSDASLNTIKEILEKTTLRGTARRAAIKGYRIMSKTGTANMLIDGKYDPDKNIYTCAGIVEKGDYQRVIVTFVKEAQQKNIYASTVAVPLFESVAEHMLIHDRIIS